MRTEVRQQIFESLSTCLVDEDINLVRLRGRNEFCRFSVIIFGVPFFRLRTVSSWRPAAASSVPDALGNALLSAVRPAARPRLHAIAISFDMKIGVPNARFWSSLLALCPL